MENVQTIRKCTNLSSLFVFGGFLALTLLVVIYCAIDAQVDRVVGYDDCGNICGLDNKQNVNHKESCGSADKQALPKVEVFQKFVGNYTILHYKCVAECPEGYNDIFNRCWKSNTEEREVINSMSLMQKFSQQLMQNWPSLLLVTAIAFVFSYIVLLLFRYLIEYIIWIIYISFIFLIIGAAAGCWTAYIVSKIPDKKGLLFTSIMFTVMAILSIILLIFSRKRIKLIAQIFKEASKALIDVPMIFFEPLVDFVALLLSFLLFAYFVILIETSIELVPQKTFDGEYQVQPEPSFSTYVARILNIIAFIWFTQLIFGCQNFVIAGTVSKWYFTRDKSKLDSPILVTYKQLVRYHLGSICLGSMTITFVKILKIIVNVMREQVRHSTNFTAQCIGCCCSWLIDMLDKFLQYLVRNAYIVMAKDGTPFFDSGKRAFNLLFKNLQNVMVLNNFGDLVLVVGRLFVVVIAALCGYAIMAKSGDDIVFPMIVAVIFAYFIANCFVSVFEMTIDTIFICYCEDVEQNDGDAKPFFMSEGLRTAMDELKATSEKRFALGRRVGIEDGNRRI